MAELAMAELASKSRANTTMHAHTVSLSCAGSLSMRRKSRQVKTRPGGTSGPAREAGRRREARMLTENSGGEKRAAETRSHPLSVRVALALGAAREGGRERERA